MAYGNTPRENASTHSVYGGLAIYLPPVSVVSGTTSYDLWDQNGWPEYDGLRVMGLHGLMLDAGAGGMTVQLFRVRNGSANAITEAISVAALSNHDAFANATLDDSYTDIVQGDNLRIVTAANPVGRITLEAYRT